LSAVEELRADEARRLFLWSQGLLGGSVAARRRAGPAGLLRQMGLVQLDTISVLARSHELVQYSRLGAVPRSSVEAAYWSRPAVAFEYLAHAFCIVPIEDWPWMELRRHGPKRITLAAARRKAPYRRVLDRLAEGPATATELGGAKNGGVWWDWSESKLAVEHLLRSGHVACVERRGWRRVYDLTERVIPSELVDVRPSDHECHVELVRRAGRHLGVGTRADLADHYRLRMRSFDDGIAESGLVPVTVEGWDEPAWADPDALSSLRAGSALGGARTTLLSPFDPVVWFRDRAERMFGMFHRLEAYLPAAKRQYGYFAMPVLASDGRIVGRVDPARSGSTLVARVVDVPGGAADALSIAEALVDAASWVAATSVVVERVTPSSAAGPLRRALASASMGA
jgi:uncharacterized protein YcaQ